MERRYISLVIPALNEEDNLENAVMQITDVLECSHLKWELLIIDDGSTDRTLDIAQSLHGRDSRVKVISLSRNFGKEIAVAAGLRAISGEAAIIMDADFQQSPDVIPEFINKWCQGYDMVCAERVFYRDPTSRLLSRAFYKLFGLMGETLPHIHSGDFRLLSRKVIDAFNEINERTRYNSGLLSWLGFRSTTVPCKISPRGRGKSKWSFRQRLSHGQNALIAFSAVPLTIWIYVGSLISLAAIGYAAYVLGATLLFGTDLPGFPSLIVSIMFFSGLQLMTLGIIGKYISNIYQEVKARPLYVVNTKIGIE
jgi:glycosyltransferase involved in cell wall biosynthesis